MSYIDEIEALIQNNRFEHYYLCKHIIDIQQNNLIINAMWKFGDDQSWILGLYANEIYNIYGQNFTADLLNKVADQFDFEKLPNRIHFSGNKEIIDFLVSKNQNVKFERIKDRVFYETKRQIFTPEDHISKIEIRLANINDLEILTKYSCDFFVEEYNGQNNKDFNEMKIQMQQQINAQSYIVAEHDNNIVGFCSRMNTVFGNEMIGTVYIDKKYRGLKAGTSLIIEMTKIILSNNPVSWLMTDAQKLHSNRIMENLNYKNIYLYTSGDIIRL